MSKEKPTKSGEKSAGEPIGPGIGPRQSYRRTGVPPTPKDAGGKVPGKVTTPQRY